MSNPFSDQAIPSYDEQVGAAGATQTTPDITSSVRKYNIDDQSQPPVAHHVHKENESLPGATGSAPTFDYSPGRDCAGAHIPDSELGYTPPFSLAARAPGTARNMTHNHQRVSQLQSVQMHHMYRRAAAPIAPYERTVLESALGNTTTKSQEFERNPLKTPDLDQSQTYQSRNPAPFIPPHVGSTENRADSYDLDGQPKNFNGSTEDSTSSDRNKASLGDKIIGTTEKVYYHDCTVSVQCADCITLQIAGKVTRNAELQEKGQNRAHPA